ncbi:MAG TPA: type II toxin-antitoxin system death-on-curing family toxin [Candidatus Saccharimonadales bacterium]
MDEIYLPTHEIVLGLHDAVLDVSGGRPGALHPEMIDGAIKRPQTYMAYTDDYNLHTVCALLVDSLARHHTFQDGNKRTALMTMLFTYRANSVYLDFSLLMNEEYEAFVLEVVNKRPSIEEISQRLRGLSDKYRKKGVDKFLEQLRDVIRISS